MLLYGLVRCVAVAFRWNAQRAHNSAQSAYEALKESFDKIETQCKAEEVALGRPVEYTDQLRLLKSFEQTENARQKWIRSTDRLQKRKAAEERVRGFESARLPYTFGLIDMTFVMRALDHFGLTPEFSINGMSQTLMSWLA